MGIMTREALSCDSVVYPEETAGYAIQDGNCKLSNGSISNPKIL